MMVCFAMEFGRNWPEAARRAARRGRDSTSLGRCLASLDLAAKPAEGLDGITPLPRNDRFGAEAALGSGRIEAASGADCRRSSHITSAN